MIHLEEKHTAPAPALAETQNGFLQNCLPSGLQATLQAEPLPPRRTPREGAYRGHFLPAECWPPRPRRSNVSDVKEAENIHLCQTSLDFTCPATKSALVCNLCRPFQGSCLLLCLRTAEMIQISIQTNSTTSKGKTLLTCLPIIPDFASCSQHYGRNP